MNKADSVWYVASYRGRKSAVITLEPVGTQDELDSRALSKAREAAHGLVLLTTSNLDDCVDDGRIVWSAN